MNKAKNDTATMCANLAERALRELGKNRTSVCGANDGHEQLIERCSDAFVDLADALQALDEASTLEERVALTERSQRRCGAVAALLAVLNDSIDLGLPR